MIVRREADETPLWCVMRTEEGEGVLGSTSSPADGAARATASGSAVAAAGS